jgi:hypothetical protein
MKRFSDHSARWQREQLRTGVDPRRYDRWQSLAPSTRKLVSHADYSRGLSARELMAEAKTDSLVDEWVKKLEQAGTQRPPRRGMIRTNITQMTDRQKKTLRERLRNDSPSQFRNRAKTRKRRSEEGEEPVNRYRY